MRSLPGTTGWQQSFHTIWIWICGSRVHKNKNCRKWQILIGIIQTFSENFIQINQVWPQLQPKTWSEAILKMYKSVHHFIIDSLQKWILKAVIDCLEIHSGLKGKIVTNWMSSLSMAASKMYFWRLSMIKWFALLYFSKTALDHVLGCSWGHTWLIWMKFSENVGMIPIKICNFLQFLFSWTNEPQIQIQIVWKLCCHPVYFFSSLNGYHLFSPRNYTSQKMIGDWRIVVSCSFMQIHSFIGSCGFQWCGFHLCVFSKNVIFTTVRAPL